MIDLSKDMERAISLHGKSFRRGEVAVAWFNDLLNEIYNAAHIGAGACLSDCCDIAALSYSGRGVTSLFGDERSPFISVLKLSAQRRRNKFVTLSAVSPLDCPDRYKLLAQERYLVEFCGDRPMYEAYYYLLGSLRKCNVTKRTIVVNITCGSPSDSDELAIVEISDRLKEECGALMLNVMVGDGFDALSHQALFPTDDELSHNPDSMFRTLGAVSSYLPQSMLPYLSRRRITDGTAQHRGLLYNSSPEEIFHSMEFSREGRVVEVSQEELCAEEEQLWREEIREREREGE